MVRAAGSMALAAPAAAAEWHHAAVADDGIAVAAVATVAPEALSYIKELSKPLKESCCIALLRSHFLFMRNFVQETVFRHNWSFVSPAVWCKYPNSKSPDVTNVDILSREVIDGKLHTRRLIASANPVPALFRRVFGGLPAETYMLEESIVDPVRRTMEMTTRNITLKQILEVEEVCVYREAGNNTSWTQMSQEFSCSIGGTSLKGMGSMVAKAEQAIINRVQSNAGKGAAILNEVVEGLMKTDFKKRGDALNVVPH